MIEKVGTDMRIPLVAGEASTRAHRLNELKYSKRCCCRDRGQTCVQLGASFQVRPLFVQPVADLCTATRPLLTYKSPWIQQDHFSRSSKDNLGIACGNDGQHSSTHKC